MARFDRNLTRQLESRQNLSPSQESPDNAVELEGNSVAISALRYGKCGYPGLKL